MFQNKAEVSNYYHTLKIKVLCKTKKIHYENK